MPGRLRGHRGRHACVPDEQPFSARDADQHFLRHRAQKVAERSMLAHDEWFDLPATSPFRPMCP
jgi:hypothetical protein